MSGVQEEMGKYKGFNIKINKERLNLERETPECRLFGLTRIYGPGSLQITYGQIEITSGLNVLLIRVDNNFFKSCIERKREGEDLRSLSIYCDKRGFVTVLAGIWG